MTLKNVAKVTRYRPGGVEELEKMIERLSTRQVDQERRHEAGERKQRIYPTREKQTGRYGTTYL